LGLDPGPIVPELGSPAPLAVLGPAIGLLGLLGLALVLLRLL
jgi:hypothetical protein